MENTFQPFLSSISIIPNSRSFSKDLDIPFVINIQPFAKEYDNLFSVFEIPSSDNCLKRCKCGAVISTIFSQKTDGDKSYCFCPFCGERSEIPNNFQLENQSYLVHEITDFYHYYVGFILDLSSTKDQNQQNLKNFVKAIKCVPPEFRMFFALYHSRDLISVLGKPSENTSINSTILFPFRSNETIFSSKFNMESFLFSSSDILNNLKIISDISLTSKPEKQNSINFSSFFANPPPYAYAKAVVFSSKYLDAKPINKKAPKNYLFSYVSIDWISPKPISNHNPINGYQFIEYPDHEEELNFGQIINNLISTDVAFNFHFHFYTDNNFEVNQNDIHQGVIRRNSDFSFNIKCKSFSDTEEVVIQMLAEYFYCQNYHFYKRLIVLNQTFSTTNQVFSILESLNPSVIWAFLPIKARKSCLKNIFNLYHRSIRIFPKTTQSDFYFNLLPSLRWFYHFTISKEFDAIEIDQSNKTSKFAPLFSFWNSENENIAYNVMGGPYVEDTYNYPPIILIDFCAYIEIFKDQDQSNIDPNSLLGKDIENRIHNRIPIPEVIFYSRQNFNSKLEAYEGFESKIRNFLK